MNKLNDYKEEIHKCSKCGLCQSVCPVYGVTGNDCSVSRGKFIMLNGVIKGDLKLNKNINKYLDMCLKCNSCKDFCPSDIDARKIFITAKAEYFSKALNSKFIRILNSAPVFNFFMNCTKLATNTYRFLRLDKLVKVFYPVWLKMGWLGKKVILANEFVSHSPLTIHHSLKRTSSRIANVVYFKGCVNEYINPRTKNAAENILSRMNIDILSANFNCCGVPFLSGGNIEQFVRQAEYNLAKIPDEFDYFLTDCASCQNAFKEYEYFINDKKLLEKLKKINEKSINVVDFILKNAESIEFDKKTTFTFHKPCHLEDMSFLSEFMKKAKNVEYIQMKEFDKCCGFSGAFAINNPEISQKISSLKSQNAVESSADYVLTSCPSCVLGLNQGFLELERGRTSNLLPFASHFIEFLALAKINA